MTDSAPSAAARVDWPARLNYAVGGIATGIIHNGLTSYVLLYYSLVLGLPAAQVGSILAFALIFDAVLDPLIGYGSDNLRSRWGRRHPLMYASILPAAVLFYLLWNPPVELLGSSGLFPWLLVMTIALRLCITCYEVPSNALVPELTDNYDERTRLLNYRTGCYFIAATLSMAVLYGYWLRDTPEYPDGLLNPAGYKTMGFWGALVVAGAMLVSTAGLHRFIPHLRQPPPGRTLSPRSIAGDLKGALADSSLLALFACSIFYSSANGTINALWAYMYSYFWGLSTEELSRLVVIITTSSPAALLLTERFSRGRDKPVLLRWVLLLALILTWMPVNLRLAGFFPSNESPWVFPLLALFSLAEITLYIMCTVMIAAMLADLVEKRQIVTGLRQEGLLFAFQMFIAKVTQGIGLACAGIALDVIRFPGGDSAVAVPADTIFMLGVIYGPCMMVLYAAAYAAVHFFKVTRADHERHLRQLEHDGR